MMDEKQMRTACPLQYLSRVGWRMDSVDSLGQTALHKAALLGYSRAVKILLILGADPTTVDSSGQTPLDVARLRNKVGAFRILSRAA